MLCVDSSRLCMSGLSLCDLCLAIRSSDRNSPINTYLLTYSHVSSYVVLDFVLHTGINLNLRFLGFNPGWKTSDLNTHTCAVCRHFGQ